MKIDLRKGVPGIRGRFISALFLSLLVAASSALAGDRRSDDESLFSAAVYEDNVSYLASDELEGRGTGQEGIDKAAEYIADYFKACGVRPAGDDGTYFQHFTLQLSNRVGDKTSLKIGTKGRSLRRPARLNEDFVPFPFSKSGSFKGDVVFVGYGIVSDEQDYDDYEDIDVTDKVLLMLRRAPQFDEFSTSDMAFRSKASRANARDAAAILIVNPTFDEEGDSLYEFDGANAGGFSGTSYGLPLLHIKRDVAERMLKAGGLPDLETLEDRIERKKGPASAALKGVSVQGRVDIEPVDSPVRNVAGLIPGTGPDADEIIVLGAHYDHLGIRRKGQDGFDPEKDISNGADDNASGTALIMTLANAYTRGEAPNRSLLLLLFTGEERGLLGSQYFVKHPTVDLDKCVAMLNFDMVGRLKKNKLEIGGMRTGRFEPMIRRLAKPYGFRIKDGGGGQGRSDHTSFYNADVPVLFFFTGLHKQYHQPEDDTPLLNIDGAISIARFAADCIDELDKEDAPPQFYADNRPGRLGNQEEDDEEDEEDDEDPQEDAAAAEEPRVVLGVEVEQTQDDGLRVMSVKEGSPAEAAQLMAGDVLVKFGQRNVESFEDLQTAIGEMAVGDQTTVVVRRGSQTVKLAVSFEEEEQGEGPDQKLGALLKAYAEWIGHRESLMGSPGTTSFEETEDAFIIVMKDMPADHIAKIDDDIAALFKRFPAGERELSASSRLTSHDNGEVSGEVTVKLAKLKSRLKDEKHEKIARAHAAPAKKSFKAGKKSAHAHGESSSDDVTAMTMPPVRLGIMPSYGDADGEGFEITGVVEGGPAAKAGMKDDDRIFKIGDKKVSDVYTYMEALRECKAGQTIPVTVIRDGKKLVLKVKAEGPKVKEAA